jgi:hypothetical protein
VSNDITDLILEHHEWFRRRFVELDDLRSASPDDVGALSRSWQPLADLLDVHAVAEEEIFYPELLREGDSGAPDETIDAIGDHNDIRDAVRDAERAPVAGEAWWAAVARAREANDEHMAEEERDALADFRRNAAAELRDTLGRRFRRFVEQHPNPVGVDNRDKDPEQYVRDEAPRPERPDGSLGIGSLKGR